MSPNSSGIPVTRHLHELREELAQLETQAKHLVAGLSDEQLHWSPAPERWSVAQCLEHLVITGQLYHPVLAAAVERGKQDYQSGTSAPYRPTRIGRWLLALLSAPARRVRAPRAFAPAARPAPAVDRRFLETTSDLDRLLVSAKGVNLRAVKTHSPATRLLRLNLGDAFAIQVSHIARHLRQASRVRAEPTFPRGEARF